MSLSDLDLDIEAIERFMGRALRELVNEPYDYVAIWNKGQKDEAGYYFVDEEEFFPLGSERFGPDSVVVDISEFDMVQLANILFHIKPFNMYPEEERTRFSDQIRNEGGVE